MVNQKQKEKINKKVEVIKQKGTVKAVDIPAARVPIAICADDSGSMSGTLIAELNKGIDQFYYEIFNSPQTRDAAEILFMGFNNLIEIEEEFDNIRNQRWCQNYPQKYELKAAGRTYLGLAVNTALDRLEKRKKELGQMGIPYYQPWLVIMTDGEPSSEDAPELERAIRRTLEMEKNNKLTIISVVFGNDEAEIQRAMRVVRRFSTKRAPSRLSGMKFSEFFEWLSQSTQVVIASKGDDSIPLPKETSWNEGL